MSLAEDDPLASGATLEVTDSRLEGLQESLSGKNAQDSGEMRERLQLVIDESEEDAFAAKRDLEVISNDAVSLETALFKE